MGIDMAGDGAQGALMGPEGSVDHRQVRLGAAHQKMHSRVLGAAQSADFIRGLFAEIVLTVTRGLDRVCFDKGLQNPLVAAFRIIVVEIDHNMSLLFPYFSP